MNSPCRFSLPSLAALVAACACVACSPAAPSAAAVASHDGAVAQADAGTADAPAADASAAQRGPADSAQLADAAADTGQEDGGAADDIQVAAETTQAADALVDGDAGAAADAAAPVGDATDDSDAAGDTGYGGDASPKPPLPPSVCDAGDEAWAIRAMTVLAGRKPNSMAEVDVLVQMIKATSRAQVAKGLLQLPEAKAHRVEALYRISGIYRSGHQVNADCYGVVTAAATTTALAKHVRDNPPTAQLATPGATMGDLARSAVELDDVSPWFDAQLFAMIGHTASFCQNVDDIQVDVQRRVRYGERFMAQYMNRTLGCLQCHNSKFSTTWSADPAKNHFFQIPGSFEASLLGGDDGATETAAYQALRIRGVLSAKAVVEFPEKAVWPADKTEAVRPWEWAPACGQFLAKGDVLPAIDLAEGFLGGPLGVKGSIWDVEAKLRSGLAKLKADGKQLDTVLLSQDPDRALAYLLGTRIVDQLWAQVYGSPLTLAHHFPRNIQERDLLMDLTQTLITSQWSLQAVLVAMVNQPVFNELSPSAGCGPAGPYSLAPLFDPFSTNNEDPKVVGNGAGDGLHREDPLDLVRMAAFAAGWVPPDPLPIIPGEFKLDNAIGFPEPSNLNELAFRLGSFLDDARPGTDDMEPSGLALWRSMTAACRVETSDGTLLSQSASLDGDFIAQLLAATVLANLTVGDLVTAIRDRLITRPDLPSNEAQATLALFGASSPSTPLNQLTGVENAARAYCGVLLASPQFWMTGSPAPKQKARTKPTAFKTASFLSNCTALTAVMFPVDQYVTTCAPAAVTVVAKVPAP